VTCAVLGITIFMRRPLLLVWSVASLALIGAGFGLWFAGRGDLVLALGITVSCAGLVLRWAIERE
jgi:ABC-type Mn2+/Zn2+ transport system permease subunit